MTPWFRVPLAQGASVGDDSDLATASRIADLAFA